MAVPPVSINHVPDCDDDTMYLQRVIRGEVKMPSTGKQPIAIDHDARQITFQIGKLIPPVDARANYHRLLDMALDALAMNATLPDEAHHGEDQS